MLYLNFHNHSAHVSFQVSTKEALGWAGKLRDCPKYSRHQLLDSIQLAYNDKQYSCSKFYSKTDGTNQCPNWTISKMPKNRIVLERV